MAIMSWCDFLFHCIPAEEKLCSMEFILNLTLKTEDELYTLAILPACKHTACFLLAVKPEWVEKKKPLTSAVSGERYFYLWPRFSIKYWRWTSKDSLDDIKAEWWLCWSLKWHSAVWRGMSSMVCRAIFLSCIQHHAQGHRFHWGWSHMLPSLFKNLFSSE